jgi:hypothetical protein
MNGNIYVQIFSEEKNKMMTLFLVSFYGYSQFIHTTCRCHSDIFIFSSLKSLSIPISYAKKKKDEEVNLSIRYINNF